MCGIFGYLGHKNATTIVFNGLKRLDYRGYDSWGIGALDHNHQLLIEKYVGKITLPKPNLPATNIAIGHTRWATHGAVTKTNAHPHLALNGRFLLAHNGIVENFDALKKRALKQGYKFKTQTDSEVIIAIIEHELKNHDLPEASRRAFIKLQGRNTIIILDNLGTIIGCRNGSPLVVGINDVSEKLTEIYISSDTLSFAQYVQKVLVVENREQVVCADHQVCLLSLATGQKKLPKYEANTLEGAKIELLGYPHYMIKEIHEAPLVIKQVLRSGIDKYVALVNKIKCATRVFTVGSGTAGLAAAQIAFYLRRFARVSAISLVGAEAKEYYELFDKNDLIIAPSQSGETADVMAVLEIAKQKGAAICSYVNMPGSMMTRLSDFKFMANAGPEVCVMSTKIFVSQIAWGYLLAKAVADKFAEGHANLKTLTQKIDDYLKKKSNHVMLQKLARRLENTNNIYLIGRAQNLQIVNEGMVKLIEGSYIHAHSLPAGDLKHYAITLIEKGTPVLTALSQDEAWNDMLNAISEVKARGAKVVAISPIIHSSFDETIKMAKLHETSAIMNVIPLHLLAYYSAVQRGNDVDRPRNIAKSVTVM